MESKVIYSTSRLYDCELNLLQSGLTMVTKVTEQLQ